MPRSPRLIEGSCYYHILTRGNDKKKIFRYNRDYLYFLRLVARYLLEHPVSIYHYCLMDNHVHFLIKAIEVKSVPKFFQGVLQTYAMYFRKRYGHVGYLFQNRYKSYLINQESYLLDCARYIERNPLRANIVEGLTDYNWSSYLYYAEGHKNEIIKEPNPLYPQLAKTDMERRNLYKNYILEERPYEHLIDKGLRI